MMKKVKSAADPYKNQGKILPFHDTHFGYVDTNPYDSKYEKTEEYSLPTGLKDTLNNIDRNESEVNEKISNSEES